MVAVSLPCFPQTIVSNIVVIIVFVVNDGGGNIGDGIWKRSEFGQNGERFCFVCENGTPLFKESSKTEFPDTPSLSRRTIRHVPR